ncbi:flagellin N-terminal helical domain-containing protein [Kineosporia succinea]|uniref:Flagellin n=1 Tax=Kineosporia succinea TaxID=84632 RepID=A0ABT9P273_9ACTN|nr:flagellin [Kineosporia succinea]MDP9826514.1 flagellin [Kineosporia succinea]
MGLYVTSNVAALNAYRNLSATQTSQSSSLEKLSSGYRINKAADDAAGLAISQGLQSQIGGLSVAVRNAQDAISVVQTADGALNETQAILQRMRNLAVQASSGGSQGANAQAASQTEFAQLQSEINRISQTTNFNGQNLLDGTYTGTFQIGANNTDNDRITADLTGTAMSTDGLAITDAALTDTAAAQAAIDSIDAALETVSTTRATLGAYQNRFQHTVNNLNVSVENLTASNARIQDTDMASEMVSFTQAQILSQAGTAMLAQANQQPQSILKLLQ